MVNWLELTRLLSFRIRNGISETLKDDGSSCIAISFFFSFFFLQFFYKIFKRLEKKPLKKRATNSPKDNSRKKKILLE